MVAPPVSENQPQQWLIREIKGNNCPKLCNNSSDVLPDSTPFHTQTVQPQMPFHPYHIKYKAFIQKARIVASPLSYI